MKKIIIVGAGFAGLNLALALEKKFRRDDGVSITLADKNDYHLFSPSLYETAASEEELAGISRLKSGIALPLKWILRGKKIVFVKGELKFVDQERKKISVGRAELDYNYLVLAVGSQSDYHTVPGAGEFALPFKTLPDALRIRNDLEFAVQAHRLDAAKRTLRVIIAGRGYSGVELAVNLALNLNFIAWKNQYPREKIELEIIEAKNQLIEDLSGQENQILLQRLKELGIKVYFL